MIRPIQYLRAIAALMVAWVHAPYVVPGVVDEVGAPYFADAGVDLFFIISGFIMVVTTTKTAASPRQFFTQRLIRIVPLYWLATFAVIACGTRAPFTNTFEAHYSAAALAQSLLFIPFSWPEYAGGVWPILPVGWTLNYEMFFYALFALSLAAPRHIRLLALTAVLAVLAFVGKVFGPFADTIVKFYTSPLLVEFAVGMLLAHAWQKDGQRFGLALSSVLIVAGFYCLGFSSSRPLIMGGAFLIVAGSLNPVIGAIRNRWLLALGNASYSIYLTHQFVLAAFAWIWMRAFPHVSWSNSVCFVALALVLCALLGWLCHRCIESPLTDYLRRRLLHAKPASGAARPGLAA